VTGDVQDADRLGTGDALLRFAAGTDEGDAALIASAFAPHAIVDFGPCGEKLGLPFPPLNGRDAIAGFLAGTSAHQITSHVVTNVRVNDLPNGAEMRALVEATHIVRADPTRRFRMLDRYVGELVLNAGDWQIERLVIDNIWFEGDPRIMLHRSEQRA
jgi:hypothetical protein